MSAFEKNRYQRLSLVSITPRSVASLNSVLPTKLMLRTPVDGPSLISKTRSTRFSDNWMTFGSTVAAKRPWRR